MAKLRLTRIDMERAGACKAGLRAFEARARAQKAAEIEGATGMCTVYPEGFNQDEYLRIAQVSWRYALWLHGESEVLGIPPATDETLARIRDIRRGM